MMCPMEEKMPEVAEAAGEQAARDQAAQQAERDLIEQRGGVSATHNESGVPVTGPATVADSGDRNFVTSPPGQQPVLAADAAAAAEPVAVEDEPPAQSALKEDWVAHAVAQGDDPEEAKDMTKAELIEKHG
jgi:hypothetical protein